MFMVRPLGFLMIRLVLILIATLFQIVNFVSSNEVFGVLFIFTILAFFSNILTTLKVLEGFDGKDWSIKHTIRPLIPMAAIIIRYFTL